MKKIPFGFPIVVAAIIASLFCLSLSPNINQNGGFDWFEGEIATTILASLAVIFGICAIIFLINTFVIHYKENQNE